MLAQHTGHTPPGFIASCIFVFIQCVQFSLMRMATAEGFSGLKMHSLLSLLFYYHYSQLTPPPPRPLTH